VVRIHWRAEPYRGKFVLCCRGTAEAPIRVLGVPGPAGQHPLIDGRDAVTRPALNYWGEDRSVVKIGGANQPPDTTPAHIELAGLAIRSGRKPYVFQGRNGRTAYQQNAAAVQVEKGEHIVLRDLELSDSGNGLFVSPASHEVLVEGCHIHDNGVEKSIYEHNAYTQATGIVFQYNHFGPLRQGCPGNNLKDRSAGLVVRCNWIEGGNRQLDLVDGPEYADDPAYHSTYVYGNILVEPDHDGNRQMVHYGGDSGKLGGYRQGTLYLYHNTFVSWRSDRTTLVRLSSAGESVDLRNNLVYTAAKGDSLEVFTGDGNVVLAGNWLPRGWHPSFVFSHSIGDVVGQTANLTSSNPGVMDPANGDWHLRPDSPCRNAAQPLAKEIPPAYWVTQQWAGLGQGEERPDAGADIGALGGKP